MREVVIQTGARLHFGLFELVPGNAFGGIGMMIDQPGVRVRIHRGESPVVVAPDAIRDRVEQIVGRCFEDAGLPLAHVEVSEFIPSHHGLGSGTQLAIAIGIGLARLAKQDVDIEQIAAATGRGKRSSIGIEGFQSGGFLIDAGHLPGADIGKVTRRFEFPESWRLVLISPSDCDGLSGTGELEAFRKLPAMSHAMMSDLRSNVTRQLCPALESGDFSAFAKSLDAFGQRIGEYFAPVQGGVLRSPHARRIAEQLRQQGVQAIVQSSWGPTICALLPNETEAEQVRDSVDVASRIVRPLNTGATIQVSDAIA